VPCQLPCPGAVDGQHGSGQVAGFATVAAENPVGEQEPVGALIGSLTPIFRLGVWPRFLLGVRHRTGRAAHAALRGGWAVLCHGGVGDGV